MFVGLYKRGDSAQRVTANSGSCIRKSLIIFCPNRGITDAKQIKHNIKGECMEGIL
jgi:hypothetical protein